MTVAASAKMLPVPPTSTRLTRDAIVAAAARLLEREGVGAVTMRAVATELGASPMSLYRHVQTKGELLQAVSERYLDAVELPDASLPWDDVLRGVAHAAVAAFTEHPALAEVHAVQRVEAPATHRAADLVLHVLRRAGFGEADAQLGLAVLTTYISGHIGRRAYDDEATASFAAGLEILLDGLRPRA